MGNSLNCVLHTLEEEEDQTAKEDWCSNTDTKQRFHLKKLGHCHGNTQG